MARPIANPITYGTLSGNVPMSDLDTSFGALFTTGFNDSSLGWVNYSADTGVANAYAVTLSVTPSSYTSGMCVAFTPQNTNTATSTINVNSLGTKTIVTSANITLTGGEIAVNRLCVLVYDGTSFRIVSPCGVFSNVTSATDVTVNAAGYQAVSLFVNYTTTGRNTNIQNVASGTSITVSISNTSGGAGTFAVVITDPSGASFTTVQAVISGGLGGFSNLGTPFSLSNNQGRAFTGVAGVKFIIFT